MEREREEVEGDERECGAGSLCFARGLALGSLFLHERRSSGPQRSARLTWAVRVGTGVAQGPGGGEESKGMPKRKTSSPPAWRSRPKAARARTRPRPLSLQKRTCRSQNSQCVSLLRN